MHSEKARPSAFVPKVILSGGEAGRYGPSPQTALGFEFHNGTGEDVTIVTRTGVQIEIPPLRGARFHHFAIVSKYRLGFNVNVDTSGLLNDEGHKTSLEAEKIDGALFRDGIRPGQGLAPEAEIEYRISRQEFHEHGGSLYLPNLDLCLSVLNRHYVPRHPFSKAGLRQAMIENDPFLSRGEGLSYQIRIVDSRDQFGHRYVNVGGKVYLIRPTRHSDVADGVYVSRPVPAAGETPMLLPQSDYYSFEEADEALRLYKTFMEAKTHGDPQVEYKRELDERNHQLKREKQDWDQLAHERNVEWETQKRAWEREREEAKREQAQREEELKRRDAELSRMEHDYSLREAQIKRDTLLLKEVFDERNHRRKELIEVLKYVPALVTGVGAIFAAYKKLQG